MRVNKFIRLWLRGGSGGIHDAATTTVSLLLTFIIYLLALLKAKAKESESMLPAHQ